MSTTRLEARSRWSLAAKCPRWASLGALGVPPADIDEATQRRFRRGKRLGALVAQDFQEKFGADNVELERAVAWPGGVLHEDIYLRSERMAVEVKSAMGPASIIDDAMLQLAGALTYDGDVDYGAVYIVGPRLDDERLFRVDLTDELQAQVEERTLGVIRALQTKGDDLPACVCATPSGCYGKGCGYTAVAWEGWQPPAPTPLEGEAVRLAQELYAAEQAVKGARALLAAAEAEREPLRAELSKLVQTGHEYAVDGISLKLVQVKPRVSWDIDTAIKAGQVDEETVLPFRNEGDPSVRWYISRKGPAAASNGAPPKVEDRDYGSVPF